MRQGAPCDVRAQTHLFSNDNFQALAHDVLHLHLLRPHFLQLPAQALNLIRLGRAPGAALLLQQMRAPRTTTCSPFTQVVAVAARLPPERSATLDGSVGATVCSAAGALDKSIDLCDNGQNVLVILGDFAQAKKDVDELVVDGVKLILCHLLPVVVTAENTLERCT
jgi:hypothetical protein